MNQKEKQMKECKKKVLKHLKEDSKTWNKLSKEAKHESKSDKKLIKHMRAGRGK